MAKLKTLKEFGVFDAIKAGAKTTGAFAARVAGKAAIKAPTIAKTFGIEASKGVAVETGFEASKHHHDKENLERERARLNVQRQALRKKAAGVTEAAIHQEPPVVLILKRKWVRLYPHGEKIALYRNDKLGVNFAVPYDEKEPTLDADPTIGAVSEGIGQKVGQKVGATFFKTAQKFGYFKPLSPEEAAAKYAEQQRIRHSIDTDIKAQFRSAAGAAIGVVGAGFAANLVAKKIRKKFEQPNKKTVDSTEVYAEAAAGVYGADVKPRSSISYYKASGRTFAKLGALAGLGFAAGKTAWEVARDTINDSGKKKKKKVTEAVGNQLVRIGARSGHLRRSIVRGVALTAGAGVVGAGLAAISPHNKKKKVHYIKKNATNEEIQQLVEIIPALAAAARVVVPIVARAGAAVASSSAGRTAASLAGTRAGRAVTPIARMAAGQAAVGAGLGAAERAAKNKSTIPGRTPLKQDEEMVDEGNMIYNDHHHHKKFTISPSLRKDIIKGAGVALGTVAVQKIFDLGYDAYRDRQEVKNAAKEAKAAARARREVAPKKVIVKKIEKPHGVTITKKEIKETAFEDLHSIAQGQHGKVKHDNGIHTAVDSYTARAIMNVHQHLTTQNKQKLERMVNKDRASLTKVADFAFRQHNS